jgi:glutamate---cysteine ligase / carboxylate-amine ligase
VLAQLPRAAAPPVFGSYAEWEAFVERFVEIGLADGYTRFWWDIRPHPKFGTLEVRAPDQPTSVAVTAALVALLQALCVTVLEAEPPRPANRGDYAQNRWAALRFGPRAELIHPDGSRLVAVPELAHELLGLIEPAARELGTDELFRVLDLRACEGDRQLEVGRDQGLEAVVADAAERTVRSA